MLGSVPRWLVPWLPMFVIVSVVLVVAVIPSAVAGALVVGLVWGVPLAIVGYRRRTGRDAGNDGMPVGRLDSLFRRR